MENIASMTVTILIACGLIASMTGCSGELYSTVGYRRVDTYQYTSSQKDRPLKCLFGNFEGCGSTEVQGS